MFYSRGLVLGCLSVSLIVSPVMGQDDSQPEMHLTTNSEEYCHMLVHNALEAQRQAPRPAPEVGNLVGEGVRLCAMGRFVLGIKRLKRALWMMETPQR